MVLTYMLCKHVCVHAPTYANHYRPAKSCAPRNIKIYICGIFYIVSSFACALATNIS